MTSMDNDSSRQRTNRVRSYMTDDELRAFQNLCAAHASTESQMVRTLVAAAIARKAPPAPPPRAVQQMDELLHAINGLHLQLQRIGTNLNQLAHQANAGRVPVSREEILAVFQSVQRAGAEVQTAAHKLLT